MLPALTLAMPAGLQDLTLISKEHSSFHRSCCKSWRGPIARNIFSPLGRLFHQNKLNTIHFSYIDLQFSITSKLELYINFYVFKAFRHFTQT